MKYFFEDCQNFQLFWAITVGLSSLIFADLNFLVTFRGSATFCELTCSAYAYFQFLIIRVPIPVVDRFLFRLPGLQQILRLTCALEGSVEECVALLNPTLAELNKSRHCHSNGSTNIHGMQF